jgi:hypothetical protein
MAVASTMSLLLGIVSGETIFFPPFKSRSGDVVTASNADSPIWFIVLMVLNAVVALVTWTMFISWLRSRRA